MPFDAERMKGMKADRRPRRRRHRRSRRRGRQEADRRARPSKLAEKGLKALRATDEDLFGQYLAEDLVNPKTGEIYRRSRRRDRPRSRSTGSDRGRLRRDPGPRHRPRQHRPLHPQHADGRQELDAARTRCSTSTASCARASRRRSKPPRRMFHSLFFDPRALRPLGRRPREDEHAPRPRRRGHRPHRCARKTSSRWCRTLVDLRDGKGEIDDIDNLGNRRVRSVGELHGEPVPRRPAAHGARDQGAHVVGRYRHRHAAGPDQRQAGGRRGARVLRLLAAVAVHGPDQPAVGNHPQAPPFGAWTGRSDPRARRLRSARRAPDPLWPHLPDRDAGRPEHRPDQLARDLRARQQVRLHRDARTARSSDGKVTDEVVYLSAMEEAKHYVAQANAELDDEGQLRRRPRRLPPRRRRHHGRRANASTSWTCRPSSSSRSPRRSSRSSRTTTPTAR